MEANFSGYATKNGLKCSDGRTIMPDAFKHSDQVTVPLVWQHRHDSVENVLGHALLENRTDGVYAYGFFNDTRAGQEARQLVEHGDVNAMSIYANNLKQRGNNVTHGDIKEVSLVLSGANPGAVIDQVNLKHGDSWEPLDDEADIYTGLTLEHGSNDEGANVATDTANKTEDKTVKQVIASMTDEQRDAMYFVVGSALDAVEDDTNDDTNDDTAQHSDSASTTEVLQHQEGAPVARNVFDQTQTTTTGGSRTVLSHSDIKNLVAEGIERGSFRKAVESYALAHSITDIDLIFPDAKLVGEKPELLARQAEWVRRVLDATKHAPMAKIKSLVADLTAAEARAKGYIKGNMKKEEVIKLLRRTTGPTTVYKKQALDRDDIIDITDLDIIAWLKWEIRFMLEEEIARAILVGDGRSYSDEDKIKDPEGDNDGTGIRSIANDHELYSVKVDLPANVMDKAIVEGIIRSRSQYRGSGTPTLYTTDAVLTDLLLIEDKFGRRLYDTEVSLAAALRVKEIVPVEVLEETPTILAIVVNLVDYTIGANKGGETTFFEDFDIDFNKNKYLLETRISGALTKPKSAIVIRRDTGISVIPTAPSFNGATNTITIPTKTGIEYEINDAVVTGNVVIDEDTDVTARATTGYFIPANTTRNWAYSYTEV